ncbi:hypothetical protein ACVW0I_001440 [Bradyrhizobium sp. LM6.11]
MDGLRNEYEEAITSCTPLDTERLQAKQEPDRALGTATLYLRPT